MRACARPLLLAFFVLLTAVAGFIVTLDRVPIDWPDGVWYASIARSLATSGSGTPSVTAPFPGTVDHARLYGPVFFTLASASFRWLGLSLASFRLVSLLGALLVAAAGALLAAAFGGRAGHRVWAATFLLLTPELGATATNGRMDSMGVALAMLALGIFVRGLAGNRPRFLQALVAGVLLSASALTTPRMLPFVASFALAGVTLAWVPAERRASALWQYAVATLACLALVGAWETYAYGSPVAWLRYLSRTLLAVDVDVAVLPQAARDWRLSIPVLVSPIAAAASGIAAAVGKPGDRQERDAERFALATVWLNFLVVLWSFNGTFAFGTYFAIPLLAVALALPIDRLVLDRSTVLVLASALLITDLGIRAAKYGGAALTWAARDPRAVEQFVAAHVPPGSDVIGEPSFYFYAVERSRSRMLSPTAWSGADWANVAPREAPPVRIDGGPNTSTGPRAEHRFFLWPVDESLFVIPPAYDCVRPYIAAIFEPAPVNIAWLGTLGATLGTPGYPRSALYALPPTCPSETNATNGGTATSR